MKGWAVHMDVDSLDVARQRSRKGRVLSIFSDLKTACLLSLGLAWGHICSHPCMVPVFVLPVCVYVEVCMHLYMCAAKNPDAWKLAPGTVDLHACIW